MIVTRAQLLTILPAAAKRVDKFLDPLNAHMALGGVDTPERAPAFIAQIGHESGQFQYVRELWGPTPTQARYEGRADLGNVKKGDGKKFMGRGLIQVTGRDNYALCSDALFNDLRLLDTPELLEEPEYAIASAIWFWNRHGLSAHADLGNFRRITKIINGGTNGLAEREEFYHRGLAALGHTDEAQHVA